MYSIHSEKKSDPGLLKGHAATLVRIHGGLEKPAISFCMCNINCFTQPMPLWHLIVTLHTKFFCLLIHVVK